jgi:hypothetical protein
MYICNEIVFNNLNAAINYANEYFALNNVILGIEEVA